MPGTVQMHSAENIANRFKSGFSDAERADVGKYCEKVGSKGQDRLPTYE